jgi:hypothetical protein
MRRGWLGCPPSNQRCRDVVVGRDRVSGWLASPRLLLVSPRPLPRICMKPCMALHACKRPEGLSCGSHLEVHKPC